MVRKALLACLLLVSIAGCGSLSPPVYSRVTIFHASSELRGKTFQFVPLQGQQNNLEYRHYAQIVTSHLSAAGMIPGNDRPDFFIELTYGIDSGKEVLTSSPIWGQTGVSKSRVIGNTVYNTPTYGVIGSRAGSETEYTRYVTLKLFRSTLGRIESAPVYQADLVSPGSSSQLAAVFPAMMRALFAEFPGKNGSSVVRYAPL